MVCALAAALVPLLGAGAALAHDDGAEGHVHLERGYTSTHAHRPHMPTGTAEPGPGFGEITLRWTPATTGPTDLLGWFTLAHPQTTGNVLHQWGGTLKADRRSRTLTDLDAGVTWTVGVQASRWVSPTVRVSDIAQARLKPMSVLADAGEDVTVRVGGRVALDGTGSRTASGTTATRTWTQTAGPAVVLDDATSATPAFTAPAVSSSTALTFSLNVDNKTHSATDTVTVTVLPSRVVSATVDGTVLKVTFDSALDANSRPSSNAFTVTARKDGEPSRTIRGATMPVAISGKTVTATLREAVPGDATLTVRYDKPASDPVLRDSTNAALPSFADRPASNAGDTTPPRLVSASMNGATMTLTFSEALSERVGLPPRAPFQYSVSSGTNLAGRVTSIKGKTVTVTGQSAVLHGQTVKLSYSRPSTKPLQDLVGNPVATIPQPPRFNVTNNTPPAFESASVDGATLTVAFDGALDTGSVPSKDAFTVKATRSNTERNVALATTNAVSISGSAVTLSLAEALLAIDTAVTVTYTEPATNPLRDPDNAKLPVTGFDGTKTVTNDTPADNTAPRLVSASMNGATMTLTFSEALSERVGLPPRAPFQYSVSSGTNLAGRVTSIKGKTVTVTGQSAVLHGQTVKLSYSRPSTKPLQDLVGNPVATIPQPPRFNVTNNTPPAFESASVDGATLTVAFDGALDTGSVPSKDAFTVKATRSNTERNVALATTNAVSISGSAVTLSLAEALLAIDTAVTVTYTEPATNPLRDPDNAKLPVTGFDGTKTVTNDTPADNTAPRPTSASVNGTTLTMTFDEALDESSVPQAGVNSALSVLVAGASEKPAGVAVKGRTLTLTLAAADAPRHDQTVTLLYVQPDPPAKPLQDLSGNKVVFIGAGTGGRVTNNTPPAFESASVDVDGDTLTIEFDGALDTAGAPPSAAAFTVTIDGEDQTPAGVAFKAGEADKVELSLDPAVARGQQTVTVGYAAPDANPLRDSNNAKLPVPGFSGETVTNATPADSTPPSFKSATANGTTLTITFTEALDESVPQQGSLAPFRIRGSSSLHARAVSYVIDGDTVTLTSHANNAVGHGETVTVDYTRPSPAANRFKDLSGNELASFPQPRSVINNTPPAFESASVNGATLTVAFDGEMDPSSEPAADAFTVTVEGSQVELSDTDPVAVAGKTVTLTLAEAVLRIETVTVGYAAPDANPLRDSDQAKLPVPDFSGETVTNATPADSTPPSFKSATANGTTLTITFTEALDESVPQQGSLAPFRIRRSSSPSARPLSYAIDGDTVTLTSHANNAVGHGETVTVEYTRPAPAANRFKDLSGNELASFPQPQPVTNNTPPAFESASVDGATLTVAFDGELDPSSEPAAGAFTVTVEGSQVELSDTDPVAVAGKTVTLTLAASVGGSLPAVTVAYDADQAGGKPLQDSDNANLPVTGFGDTKTVTNNTSGDSTAPTPTSAAVNGTELTVTFSEPLDESSVPGQARFKANLAGVGFKSPASVAVDGNTVTLTLEDADAAVHDQTVGVLYQKPTGTPLRDLSGNEVENFGISPPVLVTNNTPPGFKSARVNGAALVITFEGALDTGSVPAASAFTVTVDGTVQTPAGVAFHERSAGMVEPDQVELTLDPPVGFGQAEVSVRYEAPDTNPLRDAGNANLPVPGFSLSREKVENTTPNDTTPPSFMSASVDGDTLAIKFTEPLDESSGLVAERFKFKVGTSIEEDAAEIGVEGDTVTLTLGDPVVHGDVVRVRYERLTSNPIRDLAGQALATFGFEAVTNDTPVATLPAVASASVDGATLTVTFDRALDTGSAPAAAAFTVTVGGTEELTPTAVAFNSGDASKVELTLAAAVASGDAVTVSYDKSAAGTGTGIGPLRDAGGNEVADFAHEDVANETPGPPPVIASAAIESDPAQDDTPDTYNQGEHIWVKVTWSADVLWDVTAPNAEVAVRLDVGGTVRSAPLLTGGATEGSARALRFRYTVAAADVDGDGIEVTPTVAGDLVVLAGGATLEDTQGRHASRIHPALSGGAGHKVNGQLQQSTVDKAPELFSAEGHGTTLTLTFDEDLAAPDDPERTGNALRQAFFVQGGRYQGSPVINQSPNRVAVEGPSVLLTLGTAIAAGRPVTVDYIPEAVGARHRLKDADGNEVAGFAAADVETSGAAADAPPELARATVEGSALTLVFDRRLDQTSAPGGERFEVSGEWTGAPSPILGDDAAGSVVVRGAMVLVTLAEPVPAGEGAWLSYVRGGDGNPLRAAGGGKPVEDIRAWRAAGLEGGAPEAVSGSVSGTTLKLYFDEALDSRSVPPTGAFAVTVAGADRGVDGVSVGGTAVVLTLASAAAAGQAVTAAYTPPTGVGANSAIRDTAGNDAAGFSLAAADIANEGTVAKAAPVLAADPMGVGDRVTLTFDQTLDAEHVPRNDAFTLPTHAFGGIEDVSVRGIKVELRLGRAFQPCDQAVTLSYVPARNALRNLWGVKAAAISDRRVELPDATPNAPECVRDWLSEAEEGSILLRARRPFAQDAPPRREWFAVAASGGPVTVTGAAFAADDARVLRLTLDREFAAEETVTVSYTRPPGERGLWDVDGNQLGDVVDAPVRRKTTAAAPSVSAVALVSDPGADATYAAGDAIRVRVTFGAAVNVDTAGGTPRLQLDLDPADGGERWAAYEGGGGEAALAFAYTVVSGDASTAGVAVVGDTLEANGGTIRSAAAGADADLAHAGLGHDAEHKVDGGTAPVHSAPSFDDGESVAFAIEENHADGAEVGAAAATDADGDALTYWLSGGDAEPFEIGVDGTIRVKAGTTLDREAKASYIFVAAVADGEDADGNAEEEAAADDTIDVTVEVGNVEEPPGAPTAVTVSATSATELAVSWTAPADAGALAVAGYELRWFAGAGDPADEASWTGTGDVGAGTEATLAGLAGDTAYRVQVRARGDGAGPWSASGAGRTRAAAAAPTATGVSLSSRPAARDTYGPGEAIRVRVTFSETVSVDTTGGRPRLKIKMDPGWGEFWAPYASGSGTANLTFTHTVVEPNTSPQGIAVLANTLQPNGGAIRSEATGADADLAHAGLGHDAGHKVDWQLPAPSAPAFDDGDSASLSIDENHADNAAVGAVAATDADGDALDYWLSGGDAASFEIGAGGAIRVKSGTTLDHESKASYAFTAEVGDGEDATGNPEGTRTADDAIDVTVEVGNVEEPPGAPTGVAVAARSATELGVSWTAPSETGALAVGGYDLRWYAGESDPADDGSWTDAGDVGTGTEATVAGLAAGTAYRVQVRARGDGAGPWSASGAGRTQAAAAPRPEGATVDGRAVTVTFDKDLAAVGEAEGLHLYLTVAGDGVEQHPVRASASGRTVSARLGSGTPARAGRTYSVGYFGGGPLEGAAGGDAVAAFAGLAAENLTLPTLAAADARVEEGAGATVDFAVTLDVAAAGTVTVDYATADGSAKAGEDYTAASGTLSFGAGETRKTVSVAVLDDAHDEGEETFTLRLSNASGADIADGEATGTIENSDLMPAALLARFSRATAEQVVTTIEERMAAQRRRGFRARVAGRELQSGSERDFALGFLSQALGSLSQFAQPMAMGPAGGAPMGGAGPMGTGAHAPGAGMHGMGMPGMAGSMGMGGMGCAMGTPRAAGMSGMPGMTGMAGAMRGGPPMTTGPRAAGAFGGGTAGMGCATGAAGTGGSMSMGGMSAVGMSGGHAPMGGGVGPAGYGPAGGAYGGGFLGSMGMGGDLFSNSEMEFGRESRGGMLSLWSRSSRSHFTGLEDALSLNGDVRTTTVGADWARGPLTVGLSVGRTLGMGGYSGPSGGQMTTSMTGFYPWVGYQLNDRVSVWGTTGYGTGSLSLMPDGQSALETGVSMMMSAVGTRGELLGSPATGGFSLAFKADALFVTAGSDLLDGPTGRLNASEAGVTRVRTALEGSRGFTLGGRLSLTPSVEVGLRRDGGDAETGAGMDVGGGLAFSDTVTGLSLDVRVRTLVVHQAEGFSDRGMSLSLGWDQSPSSPLGLTARVAPSWGGQAQGGADALWGNQMTHGMGSHQMYGSGGQLNAEVGYGLPLGARLVGTPRVGLRTSQQGRDYQVGYALGVLDQGSVNFELTAEAQRRESATAGGASNGFMGRATLGW